MNLSYSERRRCLPALRSSYLHCACVLCPAHRKPPRHSKAAARLKEYGYDFLYYENIDGGHAASANLNERAMRIALEYTYLAQRLMN